MSETDASASGVKLGRALAHSALAVVLALSMTPTLALAEEEAGTDLNATNNESAPTQTEEESSNEDYSIAAYSEEGGVEAVSEGTSTISETTYDLTAAGVDLSKIEGGTYSSTVTVATDGSGWDSYQIKVYVTIASGTITSVVVKDANDETNWSALPNDGESWDYLDYAVNGRTSKKVTYTGMVSAIINAQNTAVGGYVVSGDSSTDVVSGATYSSNAIKAAVYNALTTAYNEQNKTEETSEYTYGYVGLTWAEYWAAEGVYAAGSAVSSTDEDSRGELDKGAFDTVSRATTNHGLHRGSYQCIATIYDTNGNSYVVDSWSKDGSTFYEPNGTAHTWSKGTIDGSYTMDHYEVSGTKYVPVAVKTSDLEDFAAAGYTLITNGSALQGGYGEKNLSAYSVTAEVDENTYGLKTATNNNGSFSFSARSTTGSGSGIQGQSLKSASNITVTVKDADGSYGEFLRVDLTDDYGDLGANMQAVTWTYYGNDSTYTTPLRTYGTKFAADNWMHKTNGIQLGLTDSVRCQLPEGYDGTGYWTITVSALGYADYTFQIQATSDNIVSESARVSDETKAKLQALYDELCAYDESAYTDKSWSDLATELAETQTLLKKSYLTEAAANEQITHLKEAKNSLVTATYVYMNIPYDDFYEAELTNNSVDVDVFTSATKTKTRSGTLSGGSYHADSTGESILGITYAVKLGDDVTVEDLKAVGGTEITDSSSLEITTTNRGQTSTATYTGKNALYEATSYSYYVTTEKPTNYKVVTKDADGNLVFSAVKGNAATEVTDVTVDSFSTESQYGDYQLDFNESLKTKMFGESGSGTVYAVVVNTTNEDGNAQSYGLRHIENIWRTTELAWCTGFTTVVHNCPTSSAHYESMMGNTITSVTYYTSNGIYNVDVDDIKVPVKFDASDFAVADAQKGDATTDVTLPAALPKDYEAVYTIDDTDTTVTDGKLDVSGLSTGSHTLTMSDKNGTYASFSADFEVKEDAAVEYDSDKLAIVAKDGAAENTLENYLGEIQSVSVDGTSYSASGRNSKTIVNTKEESGVLGALDVDGEVLSALPYGNHTIVVKATGYNDLEFTYVVDTGYVLMNIPYDDFYKAELTNDSGVLTNAVKVDGFTSATFNKSRSGSLAGGSYHVNSDGTDITGITYAVKVSDVTPAQLETLGATVVTDDSSVDITVTNRGKTSTTTYTGKDALFEASSYSYYVLSAEPASYKELTINSDGTISFGKATGAVEKETATAAFTTESEYGDYELDMDGSIEKTMFGTNEESGEANDGTVYAVVINTTDGTGYGLRHIENIWRTTELAWCTGFTKSVHNCPTSSEHYKSMMGKTIDSVTYYTSNGIYTFGIDDTYVPVKFDTSDAAVANAPVGATSTAVTLPKALPADFVATYSIASNDEDTPEWGATTVTVSNGSLTIPNGQSKGAYTLTVTDSSGKYASFSADFELQADTPAEYDDDTVALVAKTDPAATAEEFSAYLGKIATVTVDDTPYAATGRDATVLINASTGALDLTKEPFADMNWGDSKTVTVSATGYKDYTFTYTKIANKAALNSAIESASGLSNLDDDGNEIYTAASWEALQNAIASGKTVASNNAASEEDVQAAIDAITNARQALAAKASQTSKDELQAEVDKAASLNESDYTADSWSAYQDALAAAKAVLESSDPSQAEVDEALANLQAAREALASASSSSTSPKTGDSMVLVAGVAAAVAVGAVAAIAVAARRRRFMR